MEYNFDMRHIIQTAYLLRVDIDEIIEASKRVSFGTDIPTFYDNRKNYSNADIYLIDNAIYVEETGAPSIYEAIVILASAYLCDKPNYSTNLQKFIVFFNDKKIIIQRIAATQNEIEARINIIRAENEKYDAINIILQLENIDKVMAKICKKLKIKYEWQDNLHHLTFKNVEVGNQVEGYIKYKSITVFVNDQFEVKDIVYEFNGFVYRATWALGIIGNLHPHIDGRDICYGNRSDDHRTYVRMGAMDFSTLLLKESIHCYNPNSPYIKVTDVRTKIDVLEKIVKMSKIEKDGKLINYDTDPEEYSKIFYSELRKCPHCFHILQLEPSDVNATLPCTNSLCEANPIAEISCPVCGIAMVRGLWNTSDRRYDYACQNDTCSNSVAGREREARIRRMKETMRRLIRDFYPTVSFISKSGNTRYVNYYHGAYLLCPCCGEPLTWGTDANNMFICLNPADKVGYNAVFYESNPTNLDNLVTEIETTTTEMTAEVIQERLTALNANELNLSTRTSSIQKIFKSMFLKLKLRFRCTECGHNLNAANHLHMLSGSLRCAYCGAMVMDYKTIYDKHIESGGVAYPALVEYIVINSD